ncbi:MAG TPA: hypothetical protein VJC18_08390, partial [bacterium]|nr:hypothetical protein [bacterium]
DEVYIRADWAWSAYKMMTGMVGTHNPGDSPATSELAGVTFGNFNAEIAEMQRKATSQDQFIYYVTILEDGTIKHKLLDQPDARRDDITIPYRNLSDLDHKLSGMTPPEDQEQLRIFFQQPRNHRDVNLNLPGMLDQPFKVAPTSDYFFVYTTATGQQFRILRVPVANQCTTATTSSNYQPLGYLTAEALGFFSTVFNLGTSTGTNSPLNLDPNIGSVTFSVGGEQKIAHFYKSNIQRLSISDNIITLAFEMQEMGAPFDLDPADPKEKVLEKLLEYFENDSNDSDYLPNGEFSDPDAWADEGNRTVSFAGEELPYKLALYLVAMSVKFSTGSEKIGEGYLDITQQGMKKGEQLQYLFMGFILIQTIISVVASGRITKKLYKEAMATQLLQEDAARELAKKMRDPHWCPDFMSPMFDSKEIEDPNPYFTTPEREAQLRQVMEALTGKAFSAAFVTGPAGVGKTEMMREIQRRLLLPEQEALSLGVPRPLLGKTIFTIDGNKWDARNGQVGADSKLTAEFILFMRRRPDGIAFFDEAKMLTTSGLWGGGQGEKVKGNSPFEKMLPYLSDRKLYAVFATTTGEYEEFFKGDPRFAAFLRRSEPVELQMFTMDEVKIALATIYPVLLEKLRVISIDQSEPKVDIVVNDESGMRVVSVPRVISDLVDSTAREAYVIENPNVLMDFSIKRLKILVDKVTRDVVDYSTRPDRGRGVLKHPVNHEIGTLLERRDKLKSERDRVKSEIEIALVKSDSFFREIYDKIHTTPELITRLPQRVQTAIKSIVLGGIGTGAVCTSLFVPEQIGWLSVSGISLGAYMQIRFLNILFGEQFRTWINNTPLKAQFDRLFRNLPFWESELGRINRELENIDSRLLEIGGDP